MYKTWCETCRSEEEKKIGEEEGSTEEEKKMKVEKIMLHKYVGETARLIFEHGLEHRNALMKMAENGP